MIVLITKFKLERGITHDVNAFSTLTSNNCENILVNIFFMKAYFALRFCHR